MLVTYIPSDSQTVYFWTVEMLPVCLLALIEPIDCHFVCKSNQKFCLSYLVFWLYCFCQDDEPDYYNSRRSRRFEEDLEVEARAEKRIMNAKKVFLTSSQIFFLKKS